MNISNQQEIYLQKFMSNYLILFSKQAIFLITGLYLEHTNLCQHKLSQPYNYQNSTIEQHLHYLLDDASKAINCIFCVKSVLAWKYTLLFQIAHSLNKIEISTYQSITTVDQLFQNINYCFLPKRNQQKSSCLIYVICVCLCIVVSNAYCVVFFLCFCLRLVYPMLPVFFWIVQL